MNPVGIANQRTDIDIHVYHTHVFHTLPVNIARIYTHMNIALDIMKDLNFEAVDIVQLQLPNVIQLLISKCYQVDEHQCKDVHNDRTILTSAM